MAIASWFKKATSSAPDEYPEDAVDYIKSTISAEVARAAKDWPQSTEKSLGQINEYLSSRKDLFPKCLKCDKKVDTIKLVRRNTIRFVCHNSMHDEYIASTTLESQDKIYEYLSSLKDRQVFVQAPAVEHKLSSISSMSIISWPQALETVTWSYAVSPGQAGPPPVKRKVAPPKPKKAPVFAPILPTQPAKRAITFDD